MSGSGVERLGIGTAGLGLVYGIGAERVAAEIGAAVLREALAAGVRYVDTAAAYGDAESVVGLVAGDIVRTGTRVCTKLTASTVRARGAMAAMRSSLERLGLERVDTVMLHSADADSLGDAELRSEIGQLAASSLTARVGASTYGLADATCAYSLPWVHALQVEHSILNPSVVRGLIGGRPTEIIARSVFCKGLLTTRRAEAGAVTGTLADTLDALDVFARDRGFDLPGLALRFALDSPGVDIVVIGVSNPAELDAALRACEHSPLSAADLSALAGFDRSHDDASHPELWPAQKVGGAAS